MAKVFISSSSGVQEYDLNLDANAAPVVIPVSPIDSQTDVSVNSTIILDITDDDYNLDTTTIKVNVDGFTAFDNETFYAPYDGVNSSFIETIDGYRVEIDKTISFDSFSTVTVYAEAYDVEGADGYASYSFITQDINAPAVYDEFPSNGSTGIGRSQNYIYFKILDEGQGVDLSTISVTVDGHSAFSGGSFVAPYDGPDAYYTVSTSYGLDGYFVRLDRTSIWNNYSLIEVQIDAEDGYGNLGTTVFSFTTEDDIYPIITNFTPTTTNISRNNNLISFDIVDGGSEIDLSTLQVDIETNTVVSGTTFIAPFNGAFSSITATTAEGYDGYTVVIDYTNIPWSSYQTVDVDVSIYDFYGNYTALSWNFRIEDYEGPTYDPASLFPINGAPNASQNTNITATLYDKGNGIDFSTIEIYIDDGFGETQIYNGSFIYPYNGAGSQIVPTTVDGYDGYAITIDRATPFVSGSTITVRIDAEDKDGN